MTTEVLPLEQAARRRAEGWISLAEAGRRLAWDSHKVRAWCNAGDLPHEVYRAGRRRPVVLVDGQAVDELVADLDRQRRKGWITLHAARREYGIARNVVLGLEHDGFLKLHAAAIHHKGAKGRDHRLLDPDEYHAAVAAWQADPPSCPGCGEPLPPGLDYHSGACALRAPQNRDRLREALRERQRELEQYKRDHRLTDVYEVAAGADRSSNHITGLARKARLGAIPAGFTRRLLDRREQADILALVNAASQTLHGRCIDCGADVYRSRRCSECHRLVALPGGRRGPFSPERRRNIALGLRQFWNSPAATAGRTERAERMAASWRIGAGGARALIENASGSVRRVWKRKWTARAVGPSGGRPPKPLDEELLGEVERLAEQGLGREPIALRLKISERQVRNAQAALNARK